MRTRWILVLIIHDTNKIACWPTIRSRNGWGARNVLYTSSRSPLSRNNACTVLFSFFRLSSIRFPLPSFLPSFLPCLFLPLYLRFDGGILLLLLLLWFTFRRVHKHRASFTLQFGYFVRINIWCRFRKSHLTAQAKCIWYRCPSPCYSRPEYRRQPDQFPRTLYFKVFTFYRFFGNSSNLGRYAQYRPTWA